MKSTILLLYLLLLTTVRVSGNLHYTIRNYSKDDYHASNQNWQITQHPNGWMYVANNKGLLEFDGAYWHTYDFRNGNMRSMKITGDGRIYCGGMEQFGYFIPNSKGELEYVSLSDSLPANFRFGFVWNIHAIGNDIYFVAESTIFRYAGNQVTIEQRNLRIHRSASVDDTLYVFTSEGLMLRQGHSLKLLPHTGSLGNSKNVGLFSFSGGLLIVNAQQGLLLYRDGELQPYAGVTGDFIRKNNISCSALNDSLLALGTVQNGVFLINLNTHEQTHLSVENGLQNNSILRLGFDRQQNLWLGLDNGVDCVRLYSPVYPLSGQTNFGAGYSSCLSGDYLYLATNQGLFYTGATSDPGNSTAVHFIPGSEGQIWSVDRVYGSTFYACDNGIFVVDKQKAVKIPDTYGAWRVMPLNDDENTLLAGSYGGLYVLRRKNGAWAFSHAIVGFSESCKSMWVGNDRKYTLWVANRITGISKLRISEDLRKVEYVRNYNESLFPVRGNSCITQIDNDLVFATTNGVYRYDPIEDQLVTHSVLENLLEGKTHYSYLKQDAHRNIWYATNGSLKLVRYNHPENRYEKESVVTFFRNRQIEDFENVNQISGHLVLAGTEDGFSVIQPERLEMHTEDMNVCIRRVYSTSSRDSLIYGRSYAVNEENIVLPYSRNSVRIEFSAFMPDPLGEVLYSCRLRNGTAVEEWSSYSRYTQKEYTLLREGAYIFEVRAITSAHATPWVSSFGFTILPPWYRSVWAYLCYLALFGLVVYYVLHNINERHRSRIWQKDQQIRSLEEESLREELRYKTENLMNSAHNLMRKDEILKEIKRMVMNMSQAIDESDWVGLRRRNMVIRNKIDASLEQDDVLNKFQSSFDTLHRDFFQCLEKRFPNLNHKEKMLCAYIRMDMSSKEIAPLLGLSLRGAEAIRYRLRKKLKLNDRDNLYEFLQKILNEE